MTTDMNTEIQDLNEKIHQVAVSIKEALIQRGEMLATAESLTGGLVASSIVNEAGSSAMFAGGICAYQNEIKAKLLDVPSQVLETQGAVSAETVEAMAKGALDKFGCEWAVSTSGIAGPGGEEPGKPVGTVWMCVMGPGQKITFCENFSGNRQQVRMKSVFIVLSKLFFAINKQNSTCTIVH